MKIAKWNPFRLRNLAVGALALGILAGLWLGDVFKGLGGGNSLGIGFGDGRTTESKGNAELVSLQKAGEPSTASSSGLVRILIDDRDYFLRSPEGDRPIELKSLVRLVKSTAPNDDGLRAIIFRTVASRPSAEYKLAEALKEAGVPEKAVYLKPAAVE